MISRTLVKRVVTSGDATTGPSHMPAVAADGNPPGNQASAHGLDKGDLVDFLQSGKSPPHFIERRFAQETHAVFAGGAPYLRCRLSFQNHLSYAVRQIQKFMNSSPAAEPGSSTLNASLAFV